MIWQTLIAKHEGFCGRPYCDRCGETLQKTTEGWACDCRGAGHVPGNITIGYGTNLDAAPISELDAMGLLDSRAAPILNQLRQLDWFRNLNFPRQGAILDMAYCMGLEGLLAFNLMIKFLTAGQFGDAAKQLLYSAFAREDVRRAADDAAIINTGNWPNGA